MIAFPPQTLPGQGWEKRRGRWDWKVSSAVNCAELCGMVTDSGTLGQSNAAEPQFPHLEIVS